MACDPRVLQGCGDYNIVVDSYLSAQRVLSGPFDPVFLSTHANGSPSKGEESKQQNTEQAGSPEEKIFHHCTHLF